MRFYIWDKQTCSSTNLDILRSPDGHVDVSWILNFYNTAPVVSSLLTESLTFFAFLFSVFANCGCGDTSCGTWQEIRFATRALTNRRRGYLWQIRGVRWIHNQQHGMRTPIVTENVIILHLNTMLRSAGQKKEAIWSCISEISSTRVLWWWFHTLPTPHVTHTHAHTRTHTHTHAHTRTLAKPAPLVELRDSNQKMTELTARNCFEWKARYGGSVDMSSHCDRKRFTCSGQSLCIVKSDWGMLGKRTVFWRRLGIWLAWASDGSNLESFFFFFTKFKQEACVFAASLIFSFVKETVGDCILNGSLCGYHYLMLPHLACCSLFFESASEKQNYRCHARRKTQSSCVCPELSILFAPRKRACVLNDVFFFHQEKVTDLLWVQLKKGSATKRCLHVHGRSWQFVRRGSANEAISTQQHNLWTAQKRWYRCRLPACGILKLKINAMMKEQSTRCQGSGFSTCWLPAQKRPYMQKLRGSTSATLSLIRSKVRRQITVFCEMSSFFECKFSRKEASPKVLCLSNAGRCLFNRGQVG